MGFDRNMGGEGSASIPSSPGGRADPKVRRRTVGGCESGPPRTPPPSPAPVTPSPVVVRLKLFDGSWIPSTPANRARKETNKRRWTNLQRNRKGCRADFLSRRDDDGSPILKRYIVRPTHLRPWVKPLTPAAHTPSPSVTPSSVVEEEPLSPRELSHVL